MKVLRKRKKVENSEDTLFITIVIDHYHRYGRHDLVWRKKISPYTILVSEIMLQQTQVSRVLPKFILWMKCYPTLKALGTGTLHGVLVLWQGLGYQRRAKALLSIAKEYSILPRSYVDLLGLSGIGTYTASAICAFAYNQFAHPVLETNIRTALIEYFHLNETAVHDGVLYDDLSRIEGSKKVQSLGARQWYYALMDYGAYLKASKISHNRKSAHHMIQSTFKGSLRELRAKTLFAITHNKNLPIDERLETVLFQLEKEGYVTKNKSRYTLKNF